MTDPIRPAKSSSHMSSSALLPPNHDADSSAIRPRNRRLIRSDEDPPYSFPRRLSPSSALQSESSPSLSRGVSPLPSGILSRDAKDRERPGPSTGIFGGSLLESSWTAGWTSVTEFASSLLSGGENGDAVRHGQVGSRSESRSRPQQLRRDFSESSPRRPGSWGPEPPAKTRLGAKDIAAGSLAGRESALKAARTASVLESHEGVNGGLDVAGRFKRRTSDEHSRDAAPDHEVEEHLVYIHRVQPGDTYAGIVLRYRCREDAFRKANGLWSRDNIQTRKWLAIPVDASEIKGMSCEGPSYYSENVDLLAPTPDAVEKRIQQKSPVGGQTLPGEDFFGIPTNGSSVERPKAEEEQPWVHVRWVAIDSFTQPVEIARVPRKTLGYFPPRRKKSLHTVSTMSTPRPSLDISNPPPGSAEAGDRASGASSRRESMMSNRPAISSTPGGLLTPPTSRSRVGSGGADARPMWMRRPGGVGSLGKNVRAPGPEKDYFNSWAKKHIPGLNLDSMPSMSVMGTETANFGFARDSGGIAESPFDEGTNVLTNSRQGTGLDRAAAAVEHWLRGALAKRPGTPIIGARGRQAADDSDLIELADTNSDDGKLLAGGTDSGLPSSAMSGSRSRGEDEGLLRGRTGPGLSKGKKAD
jgi:hypothetical protein